MSAKVHEIWNEYLAPEANCPINIDSKSFEHTKTNVEGVCNRWTFEEAAVSYFENSLLLAHHLHILDVVVSQHVSYYRFVSLSTGSRVSTDEKRQLPSIPSVGHVQGVFEWH